jgi:hypothetical protein
MLLIYEIFKILSQAFFIKVIVCAHNLFYYVHWAYQNKNDKHMFGKHITMYDNKALKVLTSRSN